MKGTEYASFVSMRCLQLESQFRSVWRLSLHARTKNCCVEARDKAALPRVDLVVLEDIETQPLEELAVVCLLDVTVVGLEEVSLAIVVDEPVAHGVEVTQSLRGVMAMVREVAAKALPGIGCIWISSP